MAFPVVASVTDTLFGSNVTAHAVAMPATVASGDLLVTFFANDGAATVTTPTGWTLLHSTVNGTTNRHSTYYRVSDGTEGGTTVNFVTSATEQAVGHVYRVTTWHGTTAPEVGTAATGTTSTPDPPSLTPSWGAADTLWLAVCGHDVGTTAVSAAPTNYTTLLNPRTGTAAGVGIGSARRQLNATSDDPGTFTLGASRPWVAQTLAIRPSASGDVLLTGTSAGSSTATGNLTADVTLTGSAAGASTASGMLSVEVALTAAAAGSSTAQGVLSGDVPLSGTAAGSATASGALSVEVPLTGATVGSSTASGALSIDVAFTGTSAGSSTATGLLTADVTLTGSSDGSSTAASNLVLDVGLAGSSAGAATATGTLTTVEAVFDPVIVEAVFDPVIVEAVFDRSVISGVFTA